MSVPMQALADLEAALLRLWIVVNRAVSQLEAGTEPQELIPLLRQELTLALQAFYHWQTVKWGAP